MNDDQLDAALKELFEAGHISVEVASQPVDAFLEALFVEPTVVLRSAGGGALSDTAVADVIEPLPEPDQPQAARLLFLAAAAVLVVALLGLGLWLNALTGRSPVFSNGGEDPNDINGGIEVAPTGFIEGPDQPRIIINARPDLASVEGCGFLFDSQPGTDFLDEGYAAVSFANGVVGERRGSTEWVISDAITTTGCSLDQDGLGGGGGGGPTIDLSFATGPIVGYGHSGDDDPGPWQYTGRFTNPDDIVTLRITGLTAAEQSLQRFDDWFVLEFEPTDDQAVEILLVDGAVIETDLIGIRGRDGDLRCYENECASEAFETLQAEAEAAGATQQAEFLSSGVLSQAEYDAATADFENCLVDTGQTLQADLRVIPAGTPEADSVTACFESEIAFVESARHVQNGLIDPAEPIFSIEEEIMETEGVLSPEEFDALIRALGECVSETNAIEFRYRTDPFVGLMTSVAAATTDADDFGGDEALQRCSVALDVDSQVSAYAAANRPTGDDVMNLVEEFISCVARDSESLADYVAVNTPTTLQDLEMYMSDVFESSASEDFSDDEILQLFACDQAVTGPEISFGVEPTER